MRKEQVSDLIEHAENDLNSISADYNKGLKERAIPPALQIDIKNYMENLRSALDYMAHDIYEQQIASHRATTGQHEIKNIYFPYGQTENDFKSGVGSSLPDLYAVSQDLYDIIEEIQPYKTGDNWLYEFCSTLNENKHDNLTPQTKEVKRGLNIDFGGGGRIKMPPGASISGTGFIGSRTGGIHLQGDTISGDSPAERTTGDVNQTVIKWISFHFKDTNIEVLSLLNKALAGIKQLNEKVYKII